MRCDMPVAYDAVFRQDDFAPAVRPASSRSTPGRTSRATACASSFHRTARRFKAIAASRTAGPPLSRSKHPFPEEPLFKQGRSRFPGLLVILDVR